MLDGAGSHFYEDALADLAYTLHVSVSETSVKPKLVQTALQ